MSDLLSAPMRIVLATPFQPSRAAIIKAKKDAAAYHYRRREEAQESLDYHNREYIRLEKEACDLEDGENDNA